MDQENPKGFTKSRSSHNYPAGMTGSASGWARQRSIFATVLAGLGALVLLFWYVAAGPIGFSATSVVLVALCGFVTYRFGPISFQSLIFLSVYVPALAFLWAQINGAEYINYHNHWLQNVPYFVNSSVHLALSAGLFSFAVFELPERQRGISRSVKKVRVGISLGLYASCTLAFGFFFWLSDPSFKTIITHSYADILADRISNTQFAGGVAMIFWLGALVNYLRLRENVRVLGSTERLANAFFIFMTLVSIIWLALHARRSELIGIALVTIILLRNIISFRRTFVIGLGFFAILIIAGEIRTASFVGMFSGVEQMGRSDIESMPGGASNVFMTFVNTLHYFDTHDYFYGETFLNYSLQMAPGPVNQFLELAIPDYFFEEVFRGNYSYNGGTYIIAVFLGNFGLFGIALAGIFIGYYARAAKALTMSPNFFVKIAGLFMLAMAFRGFWYEFITIAKPIVLVLIPGLIAFSLLQTTRRSKITFL